jgi:tetratricopeptide (TPR) repeat protein/tRNA A-37 threonylcarbamoyl transferase component Bud32
VELLAEVRSLLDAQVAADGWTPDSDGRPEPERRAGNYRLEKLIGRGGMGVVYLGRRSEAEFEQQVAVKVIHLAFAADPLYHRFRQERQILASLNHPNIAHFIDGGVTTDGGLYIAMEYVDGLPLDVFCEERRLSEDKRLILFLKVCDAVEFAHQHLIVHRDLKPSNILVTSGGEPKLLDFGLGRVLSADTAAATMPMMTARYASPEQARGEAMATTTDVYSLGVILSELLSRTTEADLKIILAKAVEPQPAQRYGSVQEFAADIERYRAGRPILARPHPISYRARKFVGRHRLGAAASVALTAAIVAGIASTVWQAQRAERRFADVRQLAKNLVFDVSDGIQQLPGSTALQLQIVERSMAYLDRVSGEASTDRELRLEVAEGYQRLGDVVGHPFRQNLGDRKKAGETYAKALVAVNQVLAKQPGNVQGRRLAASIRLQQAGLAGFGGNPRDAREQTGRVVDELKALLTAAPDDVETRLTLARGLDVQAKQWNAGGGLLETADAVRVEALYDEAIAHLQTALKRRPDSVPILLQLATTETNAGNLWGSSDPRAAIRRYESTLSWLSKLPPNRVDQLEVRRLRASALLNTGWAQGQIAEYRSAIANIDAAAKLFEVLAAVDPENTNAQYQFTGVLRSRGLVHSYAKNYRAAIQEFGAAAEMHRKLSERDPANNVYRYLRGELLARMGNLHMVLKEPVEARANAASGLEILAQLAEKPNASLSHVYGACRWFSETDVAVLRDPKRAERFCRLAVDRTGGKDLDAWQGLAAARGLMGDRRGALEAGGRALELLPPAKPGEPKSQQRVSLEESLAKWRAHGGR